MPKTTVLIGENFPNTAKTIKADTTTENIICEYVFVPPDNQAKELLIKLEAILKIFYIYNTIK